MESAVVRYLLHAPRVDARWSHGRRPHRTRAGAAHWVQSRLPMPPPHAATTAQQSQRLVEAQLVAQHEHIEVIDHEVAARDVIHPSQNNVHRPRPRGRLGRSPRNRAGSHRDRLTCASGSRCEQRSAGWCGCGRGPWSQADSVAKSKQCPVSLLPASPPGRRGLPASASCGTTNTLGRPHSRRRPHTKGSR